MAKEVVSKLVKDFVALYNEVSQTASALKNEQLDVKVPIFRGEQAKRGIMYGIGNHMREHSVHIQKILRVTKASGSNPTEAQDIMRENNDALAVYLSIFSRINDEDLDNEFENQTPRKIMEHVQHALTSYGEALKK